MHSRRGVGHSQGVTGWIAARYEALSRSQEGAPSVRETTPLSAAEYCQTLAEARSRSEYGHGFVSQQHTPPTLGRASGTGPAIGPRRETSASTKLCTVLHPRARAHPAHSLGRHGDPRPGPANRVAPAGGRRASAHRARARDPVGSVSGRFQPARVNRARACGGATAKVLSIAEGLGRHCSVDDTVVELQAYA